MPTVLLMLGDWDTHRDDATGYAFTICRSEPATRAVDPIKSVVPVCVDHGLDVKRGVSCCTAG
jgi:hypothetical protein